MLRNLINLRSFLPIGITIFPPLHFRLLFRRQMPAIEDHDWLDAVTEEHVDHCHAVGHVLIRLLPSGQLLRASESPFVQPTVRIDGDALTLQSRQIPVHS